MAPLRIVLREKLEAFEIGFGPLRLGLDDALERLGSIGVARPGENNRHSSTIGVMVATVGSSLSDEVEAIPL